MLIRPCVENDMPQLLEIWLQATLHAHDFLPVAGWWPKEEAMRSKLQDGAEIWVIANDDKSTEQPLPHLVATRQSVVGFVAIKEQQLLALYVHPLYQGRGLGSLLMTVAKQAHPALSLHVCSRNEEAIHFYQQHGFVIASECAMAQDECDEYLMQYPNS